MNYYNEIDPKAAAWLAELMADNLISEGKIDTRDIRFGQGEAQMYLTPRNAGHGHPRALDLFCGAGGASMGLHRAGFDVTGVDIAPQRHYPFRFIQAEATSFDVRGYDLIWASPPCQAFTLANHRARTAGKSKHPNLIPVTRALLSAGSGGTPYIIENVPTAPLEAPIMLCGTMFGLGVFRHRHFESNVPLVAPAHVNHAGRIGDGKFFCVAGGAGRWKSWGKVKRNVTKGTVAEWRRAMGSDWMTGKELTQAIPPAYAECLGRQVMKLLRESVK